MAQHKGAIYVLGGQAYNAVNNEVTHEAVQPVEVLREATNEWQQAGDLEGKWCGTSCSRVTDDGVLVHGCHNGDNMLLQLYKPKQKVTELFAKYKLEKYADVQGIVKTGNHLILSAVLNMYMCSHYQASTQRNVSHSYIYAACDKDRCKDKRYGHYVHVSVTDVINNRGPGWQGVKMNWHTSQQYFYPGAHCSPSVHLSGDGQCNYVVGGFDRYQDKHYYHYIHRASLTYGIKNTGAGVTV